MKRELVKRTWTGVGPEWAIAPVYSNEEPPLVLRWDVYDIADRLADIPPMMKRYEDNPQKMRVLRRYVQILSNQLFQLSRTGGTVGADYDQEEV